MNCDLKGMIKRLGSELLSHALGRSIIAAKGFNGRVRDGIVYFPLAITTKPFYHSLIVIHPSGLITKH